MARTDTLGNFLTDVAEAIRTKEGTTETIPASEFDTRISNLSGGGSEDLSEELNTQDSALTTQEITIEHIITALEGKGTPPATGGGSGEFVPIIHPFAPSIPSDDFSNVTSVTTNAKELVKKGQGGFEDTGDLTSLVVPGFVAIFTRSAYTLSDNLEIVAETDIMTKYDTPYHKLIVCWCDNIAEDITVSQETAGRIGVGFISFANITSKPNVEIIKNEYDYSVNENKKLSIKAGICIYFMTAIYGTSLLAFYPNDSINRRASYYNTSKRIAWAKSSRLMISVTYADEDCDTILDGTSSDSSDIGIIGIKIS